MLFTGCRMRVKALKELYSAEEIDDKVRQLADRINADYAGRDVLVICVLKGAFMFFTDLLRHFTFSPQIDFLRMSSYGDGAISSGAVKLELGKHVDMRGKEILIVEDIVDSGRSMDLLKKHLLALNVQTLRIAALVDKLERREVNIEVDYAGFTVSSGFVVGYGLDYAERYRELPALYTAELDD